MPDQQSEADKYAFLIGHIVISWNEVHWAVYALFLELSGMDPDRAKDVFFSVRNNSTQRDMTLAAGKNALTAHPTIWESLRMTINELDKLAGERNAAIHTMWGFNYYNALLDPGGKLSFGPMANTVPHKSLKDDFPAQCDQLRATLKSHFMTLSEILRFLSQQRLLLQSTSDQTNPYLPN